MARRAETAPAPSSFRPSAAAATGPQSASGAFTRRAAARAASSLSRSETPEEEADAVAAGRTGSVGAGIREQGGRRLPAGEHGVAPAEVGEDRGRSFGVGRRPASSARSAAGGRLQTSARSRGRSASSWSAARARSRDGRDPGGPERRGPARRRRSGGGESRPGVGAPLSSGRGGRPRAPPSSRSRSRRGAAAGTILRTPGAGNRGDLAGRTGPRASILGRSISEADPESPRPACLGRSRDFPAAPPSSKARVRGRSRRGVPVKLRREPAPRTSGSGSQDRRPRRHERRPCGAKPECGGDAPRPLDISVRLGPSEPRRRLVGIRPGASPGFPPATAARKNCLGRRKRYARAPTPA